MKNRVLEAPKEARYALSNNAVALIYSMFHGQVAVPAIYAEHVVEVKQWASSEVQRRKMDPAMNGTEPEDD